MLFCSNSGYGTRAVTAHFRRHERCVCACAEQVQPADQCSPWSTASGYACASHCSRFRRHERCTTTSSACGVACRVQRSCSPVFSNSPSSLGTAVLVAHGSKRVKLRVCGSSTTRKQTLNTAESAPRPNTPSTMRALLLCAAIANALQFTTQQAKTPLLLDAATTLKASARRRGATAFWLAAS